MNIRYKYKFLLHRRTSGDDKNLSIRLRVTLHGKTPVDFPIGFAVDAADWDTVTQRVADTNEQSREINKRINEYENCLSDVIARFELIEKRVPTPEELRQTFNYDSGRTTASVDQKNAANDDFFVVLDKFCVAVGEKNQWTAATFEKFHALKNNLTQFEPMLTFSMLSEDVLQNYISFLSRKSYRNTTIARHLAFIRWFLRWACQYGYYTGTLHDTFKPKLKGGNGEQKEVIYLTADELKRVEEHEFSQSQQALERVRDVFVFCCYTGLRYSDAAKLRRSDVKNDCIHVVTKKTIDGLRIELNSHSRRILDKYKNIRFKNDLALPIISNEKMNKHLKYLGQVCELNDMTRIVYFRGNQRIEETFPKWQLLTTHVARRTFVVTALQLGIPMEVIIRWTGHSDFKAMKPYVAIVDELKAKSMSKFDDF